jgi:leader peptidase (prepilin peptidase)/N-methyltransferase
MNMDVIIVYLYIFFVGCCMGSFYNVCIYRLPRGESLVSPRSHCTSCGRTLGVVDLIPVASYLMLKGRCRYCKAPVSTRYLIVELICGLAFMIIFHKFYISYISLVVAIIFSIGLVGGTIALDKWTAGRRNDNV